MYMILFNIEQVKWALQHLTMEQSLNVLLSNVICSCNRIFSIKPGLSSTNKTLANSDLKT